MAFTELCVRSGGSNLNSGTRTGNSTEPGTSADFTYSSGNWVQSTGVFTVASGNPQSDGVAVGDFASVFPDGSTVGVFVGRVTARNTTTITVSTSAKMGTAPTDGTGNRTLKIGGAWAGPNGTTAFPFNLIAGTLTNSSTDRPRVNFKNDATYSVTAAMTHTLTGPTKFQGYTSSYGDGGRATIDGGTSGSAYVVLTVSGTYCVFEDLIFSNNGASSSARLVTISGGDGNLFRRCVFTGSRGDGCAVSSGNYPCVMIECEAYANNGSNSLNLGGFISLNNARFIRCISHDNSGSNSSGFVISNGRSGTMICCIADTNGQYGVLGTDGVMAVGCDFYNNGSHGILHSGYGLHAENCNFIKNGGYGISAANNTTGYIINCGFGAGTQANTSGTTSLTAGSEIEISGSVNYASDVTPWVDPANGDFRISLAAAKGAGRGTYLQTAASYAGTVGYPDTGAAQHQETASSGGTGPNGNFFPGGNVSF